jgi:hypothetical protein
MTNVKWLILFTPLLLGGCMATIEPNGIVHTGYLLPNTTYVEYHPAPRPSPVRIVREPRPVPSPIRIVREPRPNPRPAPSPVRIARNPHPNPGPHFYAPNQPNTHRRIY